MSARDELDLLLTGTHPVTRGQAIDAFRTEVLAEAADAVVAENDRMLWATKPGSHWAADLLRAMATAAATPPVPDNTTGDEGYPGELEHLRSLLRDVGRLADSQPKGNPLTELLIDHYSDSRMVDAQLAKEQAAVRRSVDAQFPIVAAFLAEGDADSGERSEQPHCPAEYGGPGYTHCELTAGHDGQHESALGNMRCATWGGESR